MVSKSLKELQERWSLFPCEERFKKIPLICVMCNVTWSFLFAGLFATVGAQAQFRKIDTTASFAGLGFRVSCNNKSADENYVTISPKGFGKDVRDMSFAIRGTLHKIIVDDLNEDGFPDLVLCIYNGPNGELGNITAIASEGSNSLVPATFPDIYTDQKSSEGYKGHDEFSVLVNTLLQSFPFYKPGDTETPTGGTKVIQYKMVKAEKGYTFKVARSYFK